MLSFKNLYTDLNYSYLGLGFHGDSDGKESSCHAGDWGLIPGSGRSPGEGDDYLSTPVFLPGEFHGQRSLVGYHPWDCRVRHD